MDVIADCDGAAAQGHVASQVVVAAAGKRPAVPLCPGHCIPAVSAGDVVAVLGDRRRRRIAEDQVAFAQDKVLAGRIDEAKLIRVCFGHILNNNVLFCRISVFIIDIEGISVISLCSRFGTEAFGIFQVDCRLSPSDNRAATQIHCCVRTANPYSGFIGADTFDCAASEIHGTAVFNVYSTNISAGNRATSYVHSAAGKFYPDSLFRYQRTAV